MDLATSAVPEYHNRSSRKDVSIPLPCFLLGESSSRSPANAEKSPVDVPVSGTCALMSGIGTAAED